MADYDDSDENLAENSFRARSNTWPMNRPENTLPGTINIDEPLQEIQLDDDDLFTINENWPNANPDLVDHDIMSWDPILNAQTLSVSSIHHTTNQQTQQHPQQQHHHHHHHNHHHNHHHQQQQQHINTTHQNHTLHTHNHHQQQHSSHLHHLSQHTNHHNNQQQQQQQAASHSHPLLATNQQHSPHQQTDISDEEYHIRQLNQLRLGSNQPSPPSHQQQQQQQQHYLSSSLCSTTTTTTTTSTNNQHHQHQQLHEQHLGASQQQHQQDSSYACLSSELLQLHQLTTYDLDTGEVDSHSGEQLNQLTPVFATSKQHHHLSSSHQLMPPISSISTTTQSDFMSPLAGIGDSVISQQHQLEQQEDFDLFGSSSNTAAISSESTVVGGKQAAKGAGGIKLNAPRRNAWGNTSYADLISQAIDSTVDKRLTLSQIYDWMVQHVPYFKDKGDSNSSAGWKNSVRHNLSLHNRFKRIQNEGTGKSSWWTINPEANIGKCARRRAASMEASKYEKKRRGAKKRADAIRSGLVPFPSLANASLPNSFTIEQNMGPLTRTSSCSNNNNNNNKNITNYSDDLPKSESLHNCQIPAVAAKQQQQQQQQQQTQLQTPQHQQQQADFEVKQEQRQAHSQSQIPSPLQQQLNEILTQQAAVGQEQQQQQQDDPAAEAQLMQRQQQEQLSQQQTHVQIQTKLLAHDTNQYYMHPQAHHIHQHPPAQIMNQTDHVDLFGRHAIYMN